MTETISAQDARRELAQDVVDDWTAWTKQAFQADPPERGLGALTDLIVEAFDIMDDPERYGYTAALRAEPARGAEEMRERIEATLADWTRPSAIRLMIGETMTAQEGRTANAVAAMLAVKVRAALPLPHESDQGGGE